jgi:glycerophosphoryl diester phosphodiesterase
MYSFAIAGLLAAAPTLGMAEAGGWDPGGRHHRDGHHATVELGPRPFYLVEKMKEAPLKSRLERCAEGPLRTC